MLAQCPQLAVRLQVFTESFDQVIRPAGSPCLATRASEMRSRVLKMSFSRLRTTKHSSIVSTSRGLAELESGAASTARNRDHPIPRAIGPSVKLPLSAKMRNATSGQDHQKQQIRTFD
jgi:hypothetical protein